LLGTPETLPPRNWQGDREDPAAFERFAVPREGGDITLWISREVLDGIPPEGREFMFAFSEYGRFWLRIDGQVDKE
jgi:hypothetical protein